MKLTKSILKQIIKEEIKTILNEQRSSRKQRVRKAGKLAKKPWKCPDGRLCTDRNVNCDIPDESSGRNLTPDEYVKEYGSAPEQDAIRC